MLLAITSLAPVLVSRGRASGPFVFLVLFVTCGWCAILFFSFEHASCERPMHGCVPKAPAGSLRRCCPRFDNG